MRLMYDSTNPNDIPTNAPMVAGYIDGTTFKWPESSWSRFPNAVKVRIARRTSTNDGHVLDVEMDIPTVWPINRSIVDWVLMRRRAGVEPTIYCNQLNDWEPLKRLFTNAGVTWPQWWVARYDNKKNIPAGAIAKQYANPPLVGFHADASMVADFWPGVDKPNKEEIDMSLTVEEHGWLKFLADASLTGGDSTLPPGVAWQKTWSDTRNEVAALREDVAALTAKLDQLVTDGVTVVAEGQIVIKGESTL